MSLGAVRSLARVLWVSGRVVVCGIGAGVEVALVASCDVVRPFEVRDLPLRISIKRMIYDGITLDVFSEVACLPDGETSC